jgi:drug/metabolite transporter superfamily protein YnfA
MRRTITPGLYLTLSSGERQTSSCSNLESPIRLDRPTPGNSPMLLLRTLGFFVLTALAEIVGCFLPYLWLKRSGSPWLLLPSALSLSLFAWLLTLHPAAAGRVYAAYGGVYIAVALLCAIRQAPAWLRQRRRRPLCTRRSSRHPPQCSAATTLLGEASLSNALLTPAMPGQAAPLLPIVLVL